MAAGFAAFVAKSGARTLLIDADLRNPSMTRTLGYTERAGIARTWSRTNRLSTIWSSTDAKHKFDFLPSSTRIKPSNSSDILNSQAMKADVEGVPRTTTIMSWSTCPRCFPLST